jgi:hypothetical protein
LRQLLALSLSLFLLVSCATGGRNERYELKNFYTTGALDQGLKFLEESKYFKDEKEKLLYLMEKGMFLHQKGEYEASNLVFDEAIGLVNLNYTISLSKKVEKSVLNDNYDKFYGEIYEHSMLYFYSSLNSLLLFNKTQDKNWLFKARASILGWDAYLNSIKDDRVGKTVYKKDLVLKIYGAKIHELIGTKEDQNIALNLYKDAEDILFKNYNTYNAFNFKAFSFKENYEKLPNLKLAEVKTNYVDETAFQTDLKKFIKNSITNLNDNLKKKKNKKEHMSLLLEKDLIAEKISNKVKISLEGLSNEPIVRYFVANVLGLYSDNINTTTGDVYTGMASAALAMKMFSIYFELPAIALYKPYQNLKIVISDLNGVEVTKENLSLLNPMADIAKEAVEDSSGAIKARVSARLAGKHIAAIMASFATYKALGGGTNKESVFAKNAAVLQYAAATAAIAQTETADTRYWSTLPNEIRLCDLDLDPGEYKVELEIENEPTKLFLGNVKIQENNPERILVFRK